MCSPYTRPFAPRVQSPTDTPVRLIRQSDLPAPCQVRVVVLLGMGQTQSLGCQHHFHREYNKDDYFIPVHVVQPITVYRSSSYECYRTDGKDSIILIWI